MFLTRFVALSPIKTPQWPRFKSTSNTAGKEQLRERLTDLKTKNIFAELEPSSDAASTESGSANGEKRCVNPGAMSPTKPVIKHCSVKCTDLMWKTAVLERCTECSLSIITLSLYVYTANYYHHCIVLLENILESTQQQTSLTQLTQYVISVYQILVPNSFHTQ